MHAAACAELMYGSPGLRMLTGGLQCAIMLEQCAHAGAGLLCSKAMAQPSAVHRPIALCAGKQQWADGEEPPEAAARRKLAARAATFVDAALERAGAPAPVHKRAAKVKPAFHSCAGCSSYSS